MIRTARQRAAVLALLMLAACAAGVREGFAAPAAPPAKPSAKPAAKPGSLGNARFLAWWRDDQLCAELGIAPDLRKELAARLENLQTSYQLEQTKLNDARAKQSAMLADPKVSREQLLAFNRAEVAAASEKMQSLNFEARLLVRGKLAPGQLEKIVAGHPRFFVARWFKMSQVPVREGQVVVDDE